MAPYSKGASDRKYEGMIQSVCARDSRTNSRSRGCCCATNESAIDRLLAVLDHVSSGGITSLLHSFFRRALALL